jgi:hypothetical protein
MAVAAVTSEPNGQSHASGAPTKSTSAGTGQNGRAHGHVASTHAQSSAGAAVPTGAAKAADPSTSALSTNRQGNGPNPHAFPGLCRAQIASAGHPNANSVVPTIHCGSVTPVGGGADHAVVPAHPNGPPTSGEAGPTVSHSQPVGGAGPNSAAHGHH